MSKKYNSCVTGDTKILCRFDSIKKLDKDTILFTIGKGKIRCSSEHLLKVHRAGNFVYVPAHKVSISDKFFVDASLLDDNKVHTT